MNLEQVMAMTDEALRIRAAELAGWTDINLAGKIVGVAPGGGNDDECFPIPDYPHEIAAAWELVRSGIAEHGPHFALEYDGVDGKWMAAFYDGSEPFFEVEGNDPSIAITRSFVLAMTQENNG